MVAIPAGYLESTFVFELAGSTHQMAWTMGWDDADFPSTTASEEAEALYNAYVGSGKPITAGNMCIPWSFLGVRVTKQLESGPISGEYFLTVAGTGSGAPLAPNVSTLWQKRTALGGRRNRGRAYIPPVLPSEGQVDALGVIASATITTLQTAYNAFLTAAAVSGLEPVLFHQSAPYTPTPITSFQLQPLVATQRRRLRR